MLLIVRFQFPLGQKSGPVHNLRSTFSRTRNFEARTFVGVLHASTRDVEGRKEGRMEKVGGIRETMKMFRKKAKPQKLP